MHMGVNLCEWYSNDAFSKILNNVCELTFFILFRADLI